MKNNVVSRAESGFTLIELAIVLVIIGLLVGGVLVGQDLIKSATINAVVAQLDRLDAGVNTFRDKYSGLPGDLLPTRASQFGLTPAPLGTTGEGDGNGIIQNSATAANQQGFGGETNVFWLHLGGAGAALVPDQGGSLANPAGYAAPSAAINTNAGIAAVLPLTRLRDTSYIHIYSVGGRNYYYVGGFSALAITTGIATLANAITPTEAFGIDNKRDDGNGITGVIQAVTAVTAITNPAAGTGVAGDCFTATQGVYASNPTSGQGLNCNLSVRTSW